MNPTISIVFTSYNHKEYLGQAIESLLNQTYTDFELIIVDDCSTDGSQNIIKGYAEDPRVRLFLREQNSGSYVKASNYGAKQARGEFLLFAQCDDFAEPEQLSVLYSAMLSSPSSGIVFSCSNMIDSYGIFLCTDFSHRDSRFKKKCAGDTLITKKQMQKFLFKSCVIPNLSAALLRKECYEYANGFSEAYLVISDWFFWLTLSKKYDFFYIVQAENNFRQHATTIRSTIKLKKQVLEIYDMFYAFMDANHVGFKNKYAIKTNLSKIWLEYITMGWVSWVKSFFSIFWDIFRKDICSPFYVFIGFIEALSVYFSRKISKIMVSR